MSVQAVQFDDLEKLPRMQTTRARSLPACPICSESLVAAEASALRDDRYIQHLWTCEACGYGFVTEGKIIICH